jgi:hypothetical protein
MADIHNYFEGWAVVELFGHGKAIGFVTTEYFGNACLFRCDTPERATREYVLDKPTYGLSPDCMSEKFLPIGTKVKRQAMPAHSRLIGPASIFALNPVSEEVAMKTLERDSPRPLICLEMPTRGESRPLLPGEAQPIVDAMDGADEEEDRYEDDEEATVA